LGVASCDSEQRADSLDDVACPAEVPECPSRDVGWFEAAQWLHR
jgi:hypothetical protein